jgi:hypothetical protein
MSPPDGGYSGMLAPGGFEVARGDIQETYTDG